MNFPKSHCVVDVHTIEWEKKRCMDPILCPFVMTGPQLLLFSVFSVFWIRGCICYRNRYVVTDGLLNTCNHSLMFSSVDFWLRKKSNLRSLEWNPAWMLTYRELEREIVLVTAVILYSFNYIIMSVVGQKEKNKKKNMINRLN